MIPLVITAHLAAPVAYHPADGLALDGPLLYAATLARLGEDFFRARPPNDALAAETAAPDPAVPLAVHRAGDTWIYACSLGVPVAPQRAQRLTWNKRFDDGLAQRAIEAGGLALARKSKVQINSGEFKSYHMPLYLETAAAVQWYAVGEPVALRQLLSAHVLHLGKKRNTGHGAVLRWEVAAWPGRADRWQWADDARTVPARAIPLDLLAAEGVPWAGETAVAAVRPPSWLAAHQVPCAVPPTP